MNKHSKTRRKVLAAILVLTMLFTLPGITAFAVETAPAEGTRIDILTFADFHGRVDPPSRTHVTGEPGAARFAAYAEYLRQQNPNPDNVLIIGGGDDFHGYASSNFLNGANVAEVFETMGVSHFALGNHEFSFGQERAVELGTNYDFTLLAADLFYAEGHPNAGERPAFVQAYDIVEFEGGITIGLFGLMNPNMRGLVSGALPDFDLRTPFPAAPQVYSDAIHDLIAYLREERGVNAVVAVTHMGGNSVAMTYLAEYFDIDAALGGHYHAGVERVHNGVPIIEAGQHGQRIGRFELSFDANGELLGIETYMAPLHTIRDFEVTEDEEDPVRIMFNKVEEVVERWEEEAAIILDAELGPVGIYFGDRAGRDFWVTRLLLEYVQRATGQEDWVAVTNTGGWRNTGLWPRDADDPVSHRDLLSTMPFNNIILLFEMYGRDLKFLLDGAPGMPAVGTLPAEMMGSVNTGVHVDSEGYWVITATNQRITDDGIYNVIGSNFIWNRFNDDPENPQRSGGGDRFPFPGNAHGDAAGMTFISYPRALTVDGETMVYDNDFTRSAADWEGLGLRNLRESLREQIIYRTANPGWQSELTLTKVGTGSAVITAPFAPGDGMRNVNVNGTWVTIEAKAPLGHTFVGWYVDDELLSEEPVFGFLHTEDKAIEARFEEGDYEPHYAFMQGDGEGTIRPSDNLTRAEAATLVARIKTDFVPGTLPPGMDSFDIFSDVTPADWFFYYVAWAYDAGYVQGFDGRYRPGDFITREEFMALIARTTEVLTPTPGVLEEAFGDAAGIDLWALDYVYTAYQAGWVRGDTAGNFNAGNNIIRAEVATAVNRMLGRIDSLEALEAANLENIEDAREFSDVSDGAWYFASILAAANDHVLARDEDGAVNWMEIRN